ncbi:MAG TPA: hypothetical protein VNW92_07405 [Polyangiaceae bacterium]|nr:hypothetical protein [Polyangiaceae bacterium]
MAVSVAGSQTTSGDGASTARPRFVPDSAGGVAHRVQGGGDAGCIGTGDVLAHLAELEERKLHLELGFSSTFAYRVEALGMSEGAAGRRVTGARVCRRFPEVFALVARGELHLSALCELGPHLNPENANELFEVCRGKEPSTAAHCDSDPSSRCVG